MNDSRQSFLGMIVSTCKECDLSMYQHGVKQVKCSKCGSRDLIYKTMADVLRELEQSNDERQLHVRV
jgi:LSD1 subclass zinc finger protein